MATRTVTLCGELGEIEAIQDFFLYDYFPSEHRYILGSNGDYLIAHETSAARRDYQRNRKDRQIRLFLAGEAVFPDFNIFDYALGFDHLVFGERYTRLHPLILHKRFADLLISESQSRPYSPDRPYFCDFIYSNRRAHPMRDELFRSLSAYRQVHSFGRHLNNANALDYVDASGHDWVEQKIALHRKHCFSLAIENATYSGYTSEKVFTALLGGAIPIYWGNPQIGLDVNEERLINVHQYARLEEVVDVVAEIEENSTLFEGTYYKPPLTDANVRYLDESKAVLHRFFQHFFSDLGDDSIKRGIGTYPERYERHDAMIAKADYRDKFVALRTRLAPLGSRIRQRLEK